MAFCFISVCVCVCVCPFSYFLFFPRRSFAGSQSSSCQSGTVKLYLYYSRLRLHDAYRIRRYFLYSILEYFCLWISYRAVVKCAVVEVWYPYCTVPSVEERLVCPLLLESFVDPSSTSTPIAIAKAGGGGGEGYAGYIENPPLIEEPPPPPHPPIPSRSRKRPLGRLHRYSPP